MATTCYVYLQVVNCHDSVIYLLAPLRYATVHGCSDTTIVLGAVGKVSDTILRSTLSLKEIFKSSFNRLLYLPNFTKRCSTSVF